MLPPCPQQVGTGEVVSSPSASSRTLPLAFLDPPPRSCLVVLRLALFEKLRPEPGTAGAGIPGSPRESL